jgi:two-component system chemotaxis response regulator CheB
MAAPAPAGAARHRHRVLIVDDSAVVRGLLFRWLQDAPEFEIVGLAVDGGQAIKKASEHDIDLCVLDVEMPVMTGLEALPKLLALRPAMRVLMCSTLTQQGAAVTLRALDLGAADFIGKPEANRLGGAAAFRDELLGKLRKLGEAKARLPGLARAAPPRTASIAPIRALIRPDITVIGASTGGPPALRRLLCDMGPTWPTPIAIVQHMPATFTRILAEHLTSGCKLPVREAADGQSMEAGCAYVAPGDWHLTLRRGARPVAVLDQDPAENWCRPAVDKLFRSAASAYGGRVLAVILTGMGHDGRDGARALAAKGAPVIAQDEASSVVWGMPGAVVEEGLATDVKPLADLGGALWKLVRGVGS